MDSGLAADDQYNLYDKALFADRGSNLYRPNKGADTELHGGEGADEADIRTERFKPTKVRPSFPPGPPWKGTLPASPWLRFFLIDHLHHVLHLLACSQQSRARPWPFAPGVPGAWLLARP